MWSRIAEHISQTTKQDFKVTHHRSVGGGSINQAYAIIDGDRELAPGKPLAYFVKVNTATGIGMFEAEALGLRDIARTQTIRVPHPICWGTTGHSAYLVLEWLDLGYGTHQSWQAMGHQLAALHRVTSAQGFGWDSSNTIGSTPQKNPWTENWTEFYGEHRLRYQFQLARRRGGHFPQEQALMAAVPSLLADHHPQPALVHGDLWSGNAAVTKLEEPVILDPAVYYGDREVDLAMSELFGGFPGDFYRAYNEVYPLEAGYSRRKILYNLYHILNHFNLFGGSYEAQANRMIASLLT